ncbi:Beta-monoglucosyldiacylglycerol synthase [Phycisphaerae bacterium RAS1]|nr:Beta-monoglucosyldiacylglycerol synthase [Phycisphaerae bacterium RAS1]
MSSFLETACLASFLFLMIVPGVYGVHLYLLMFLSFWRRSSVRRYQAATTTRYTRETPENLWPIVTTQIPLYNEVTVARRVIEAAARMDYPVGRHEVQILDDSSDETRELVDQTVLELRARGYDVSVVRRADRTNYKAGALAHGLKFSRGKYIAIFDADFVPDHQFLRKLVPLIESDPQAGCVQGRWGHLNAGENWITEGLALGIDGHFSVEQGARAWSGFLLNFNGTGGIWRRAAIDDPRVGGWHGDTITEDLDLSYRAQLVGWRVIYCNDVVSPAEIPADVNALKSQQRRWATGSIQTARKLLPLVWKSPISLLQKLEATLHLTQYSVSVFMLLMAIFGRTLLWTVPAEKAATWLGVSSVLVLAGAAAPSIAYMYARWTLSREVVGLLRLLKFILLGFGLAVNNGVAVLVGLVQRGGEFVRTPKSGASAQSRGRGQYASLRSKLWLFEIALGAFCLVQWAAFLKADHYVGGSFMLLYAFGLIAMGLGTRRQTAARTAAHAPPRSIPAAPVHLETSPEPAMRISA